MKINIFITVLLFLISEGDWIINKYWLDNDITDWIIVVGNTLLLISLIYLIFNIKYTKMKTSDLEFELDKITNETINLQEKSGKKGPEKLDQAIKNIICSFGSNKLKYLGLDYNDLKYFIESKIQNINKFIGKNEPKN